MERPLRSVLLACILVLGLGTLHAAALHASAPVPPIAAPAIASYRMTVRLDPVAKTVTGDERISYRNPSRDTLDELWLRLYLRAFRSPETLWMREADSGHRGFAADPQALGDITISHLALANGTDLLASATITDTLMRVPLPAPLKPDQTIDVDVHWVSTLPRVFARTGFGGRDDTFFMVGQWYPKMVVYDRGHWDTEPWHANAEFFNDFGTYDVAISAPSSYIVAGAGVPVGESVDGTTTTHVFRATSVTDFAFAASPDFQTRAARAGAVEVMLYYLPEHAALVDEYLTTSVGALQAYSAWYGPYPHPRLTVIDVPNDASGAGGMEYPTLVTGGSLELSTSGGLVSYILSHEIAHQWWPMQTATNEGREPWLDEGLTEYSGARYIAEAGVQLGIGPLAIDALTFERASLALLPNQPATLPSWEYDGVAYQLVYTKTTLGLWTLERIVGTDRMRRALADYAARYRFTHPTAAEFRSALEHALGEDLSWFFDDYLAGSGTIDYTAGRIENQDDRSIVWITRSGSVAAPVEIAVTFADGQHALRTWDGQSQVTSFQFAPGNPVASVALDPQRKLVAELNIGDNSVTLAPQTGAAWALSGRLAFWLQSLVQCFGLFG